MIVMGRCIGIVEFNDLTLREGSQVPSLHIDDEQGRRIVEELAALDVSCVELSFPRAQERESRYRDADELGLRTTALARAIPEDVDAALAADPDEVEVIVLARTSSLGTRSGSPVRRPASCSSTTFLASRTPTRPLGRR